jgi:hypothetical protein
MRHATRLLAAVVQRCDSVVGCEHCSVSALPLLCKLLHCVMHMLRTLQRLARLVTPAHSQQLWLLRLLAVLWQQLLKV